MSQCIQFTFLNVSLNHLLSKDSWGGLGGAFKGDQHPI